MKKIIVSALAAALLLTMPSCGRQEGGATLTVDLSHSYASAVIGDGSAYLMPMLVMDGGVVFWASDGEEEHFTFWHSDTGESERIAQQQTGSAMPVHLPGGQLGLVYTDYSDVSFNGRDFDYEGMRCYIEVFDSDLHFVEGRGLDADLGTYPSRDTVRTDADGYWYITCSEGIRVLDPSMQEIGTILGAGSVAFGSSGAVYAQDMQSGGLMTLDRSTLVTQTLDVQTDWHVIDGGGAWELCAFTNDAILGWKQGEEAFTEAVSYVNSDFIGSGFRSWALPDGRFILLEYGEETMTPWLLTERTKKETQSVQVVGLSGVDLPPQLCEDVIAFNRSRSDVRIVLYDYADGDGEDGTERFRQDMLSGVTADIVCTDNLSFASLANKGIFVDLTERMESDERFDEADYLMNCFDSLAYGGKRQRIGFSYIVSTVAAKTAHAGEQQGRTAQEYAAMLDDLPEGMAPLSWMRQDNLIENFLLRGQSSYVDTEAMTCSFDTPEFMQLLELAGTMPSFEDVLDGIEAPVYDCAKDEALLYIEQIGTPLHYHTLHEYVFGGADITLVGFPGGGNGGRFAVPYTLSLNAQSAQQDAAWEFFLFLLSEEQQEQCSALPVRREALQQRMTQAQEDSHEMYWTADGTQLPAGKATPEEMQTLYRYIEGITMAECSDPAITAIISEEAEMYFAGDCTAQQASSAVQSRVEIYLAEHEV